MDNTEARKIIIVGNSSVGKTSVASRYVYGSMRNNDSPTIGLDIFRTSIDVQGRILKVVIWDTAGQERFRAMDATYFRNAVMAVIMFSLDCRESFTAVEKWFNHVRNLVPDAVMIIAGNKQDLEDKRMVETQEGSQLAAKLGVNYIETSGVNGSGVDDLFLILAEEYMSSAKNVSTTVGRKLEAVTDERRCC